MLDRRELLLGGLAAFLSLRGAPPAAGRRLGGTPLALVTADLDAQVVAVALESGRVVRRVPTVEGPRSIDSVRASMAVVAHPAEGVVSIIDGASLRVRRVLRSFARPRYTAVHPNGRYAYVTDSGLGELVTLDAARARVLHRLELSGPARHLAIDSSGRTIWAALGTRAHELAIIDLSDPESPRLQSRVRPPFRAHDVGISPAGGQVWVTAGSARQLAVYGAGGRRIARRLEADGAPQHVTFKGGHAYVTSGDEGTLRIHRLDGRLLRSVSVPVGCYNVSGGWTRVFTPSLAEGTLSVLDQFGTLRRQARVGEAAHDACFIVV